MHFPEEGLVFDYRLEDAGISSASDEEDEEEEGKVTAGLPEGTGGGAPSRGGCPQWTLPTEELR